MTNVLFARLNRKHYVSFSFTVGKMLLWKNVEQYYLTITTEFHALCLREVIIGITMSKYPLLNYLLLIGKLYLWDCRIKKGASKHRFQIKSKN